MDIKTVKTQRFGTVEISAVYEQRREAFADGYTEPTYYNGPYDVRGRSVDMTHMQFCICPRR